MIRTNSPTENGFSSMMFLLAALARRIRWRIPASRPSDSTMIRRIDSSRSILRESNYAMIWSRSSSGAAAEFKTIVFRRSRVL